ncbi:MAG: polymer-forming cytoskeletal protein [Elusimicrobia bacterium]|nr:polymer-forming cytoskeletal protein [Elusimicrobiota bacterium]
MNKKKQKLFDTIETLVGNGSTFRGEISATNSIRIDGTLIGSVKEAANVIVGENAKVKGNICANYVVVDGIVEGNITATESIELLAKSKVTGDITTTLLSINEGAIFKGKSVMLEKEENIEEIEGTEEII